MRVTAYFYVALAVVGAAAAITVPIAVHQSGSAGFPFLAASAIPGSLSRAHEFIGAQCESCHVPTRGVEAVTCVACHATAAAELLTRSSTAFHQDIGECAGCHVEHLGRDRRPVNMDHGVLTRVSRARAAEIGGRSQVSTYDASSHVLAHMLALLAASGADLAGSPSDRRSLPAHDAARLDCASCHANRDQHRTLFGRDCQGCHNTAAWTIAAYRHPSSTSRECAQCHHAPPSHYMMHFMMLQMMTRQAHARVEQCQLCHQTDSWNNIRGVGWFEMH